MPHPDASSDPERLVLIFAASSSYEGFLAQGLLQSEGIPTFTKGEGEGPYRTGPMYLWVPEAYEIQARMLLEEARRGDLRSAGDAGAGTEAGTGSPDGDNRGFGGSSSSGDLEMDGDQEAAGEEN
jgi:hypothetical protein